MAQERLRLAEAGEWVAKVPPILRTLDRELGLAQQQLRKAIADAETYDVVIREDGSVFAGYRGPGTASGDWQARERHAEEVATAIREALRAATVADTDAASELRAAMPANAGLVPPPAAGPAQTVPQSSIPPRETPPAEA